MAAIRARQAARRLLEIAFDVDTLCGRFSGDLWPRTPEEVIDRDRFLLARLQGDFCTVSHSRHLTSMGDRVPGTDSSNILEIILVTVEFGLYPDVRRKAGIAEYDLVVETGMDLSAVIEQETRAYQQRSNQQPNPLHNPLPTRLCHCSYLFGRFLLPC